VEIDSSVKRCFGTISASTPPTRNFLALSSAITISVYCLDLGNAMTDVDFDAEVGMHDPSQTAASARFVVAFEQGQIEVPSPVTGCVGCPLCVWCPGE
jgi:hypothetical protein